MPNATRRGEAFNKYSEATRICFFLNPQLFLSGYGFRPSVSGESGSRRIRKFLNPLFQSANSWIRYESGIVWTPNPDIFSSGDITRSSPVLYRDRQSKIQTSRALRRMSCCNILKGVLGTRVNPHTCRIHVDGQIWFEYGYVWCGKSCGFKNIWMPVDGAWNNTISALTWGSIFKKLFFSL